MGVIWIPGAGQGPWAKCEKINAVGRGMPLETAWKLRDAKRRKERVHWQLTDYGFHCHLMIAQTWDGSRAGGGSCSDEKIPDH